MYNSRYETYLQETFGYDAPQTKKVLDAMHRPLGKSIRINTQKVDVSSFISEKQKVGWHFQSTDIPEVFYVDRDDTSTPLGSTPEHLGGQFYIQEAAAAHPPHIMRETISQLEIKEPELILDMCSSPGGKTTQLAQYFPNSLIIANEADRGRLPQLYENLDRMGHANICVTNYDGRFYQHFPEMFDAILLDAPCSGEGCAFKTPEALRNWHIKNIRRIAKLQYQLFITAMYALKPGGVLIYSTCTLNKEENEGVIEKGLKRLQKNSERGTLNSEPIEQGNHKRFWPHETHTGGFFYSSFQKLHTLPDDAQVSRGTPVTNNNITPATNEEKKEIGFQDTQGYLYSFKKDRYVCSHDLSEIMEKLYFTKVGTTLAQPKKED